MRRTVAIAVVLALAGAGSGRTADLLLTDFLDVLGDVSHAAQPVERAVVVAFNLSTYKVVQTFTTTEGVFRLPPLPAGIYRIVAVKNGFVPAIATIIPDRRDHRITLKLRPAGGPDARNAIWEIRRSLPADVLRELGLDDFTTVAASEPVAPARLSGEMISLAAVDSADRELDTSYAQAAVGVRGPLGGGWSVNFTGRRHQIDASNEEFDFRSPLVQSSGVAMEIRSSEVDAYRFASTRNSWLLDRGAEEVDLEAHRVEWQHADSSVRVRYFSHENLFADHRLDGEVIELSGERRLRRSARSDFDVFLKVGQENFTGVRAAEAYRTAAFSATGRFAVLPAVRLRYGMHTYVTENRSEWAPETGAEFQLGKNTSLAVSALYKVLQADSPEARLPSVVFLNQGSAMSPRYRYSIGFVSGDDRRGRISGAASVASIDSLVRVVFDDRFDQFWDAFFLENGDQFQDITVSLRKRVGNSLMVDFTTTAGRAANESINDDSDARSYLTGTVQSLFRPSRTSLEVSYRQVEQARLDGRTYDSERLNLRVGQSLYLPLDLRLLLGVDLARAPESPVVVDAHDPNSLQRRLVGGLSLAF